MRFSALPVVLVVVALLAACSTPETRISGNRAAFDRFPADVQQKIRAGRIDVGFTGEMVRIALGEPARRYMHKSELGDSDLWIYHDEGPHFSLGIGVGSAGRHSAMGAGLGVSAGDYDPEERMRVEFRAGRVTSIEVAQR